MLNRTRLILFAAAVVLTTGEGTVFAETTDPCDVAAVEGQVLQRAGKLLAAREQFLGCSRQTCVEDVAKQCTRWLEDVERALPTIVVDARDPHGKDLVDVRVSVDNTLRASSLDGHPLILDPGVHEIRVEAPGLRPAEERVVIREGEKERRVTVELQSIAPPIPPRKPVLGYVLLGAGGLATVSWATFGIKGLSDHFNCRTCTPDAARTANTELLVADISAAVTIVTAGLGALLLLSGHPDEAHGKTVGLDVGPIRGGVTSGLSGSF